jgi:hypothetical protein
MTRRYALVTKSFCPVAVERSRLSRCMFAGFVSARIGVCLVVEVEDVCRRVCVRSCWNLKHTSSMDSGGSTVLWSWPGLCNKGGLVDDLASTHVDRPHAHCAAHQLNTRTRRVRVLVSDFCTTITGRSRIHTFGGHFCLLVQHLFYLLTVASVPVCIDVREVW